MDHTFRVATFNTFNLVLPGQPLSRSPTHNKPTSETQLVKEQLYRMMSDVVVFQESFIDKRLRSCDSIYPTIIAPRTEENHVNRHRYTFWG